MIFPFSQVFAHQLKGANEFVLGAMITGSALASIVFAVPAGRIADKVGRKKVLFVIIPLFWLSNLMLIWAPLQALVILAGTLQGFFYIGGPIIAAMERELVPADEMGRWIGLNRLFKMIISAVMALGAGFIWDKIGPQYVFIFFVILDAAIRIPLLISMPETLHGRLNGNGSSRLTGS
jgi:MFS family permease